MPTVTVEAFCIYSLWDMANDWIEQRLPCKADSTGLRLPWDGQCCVKTLSKTLSLNCNAPSTV